MVKEKLNEATSSLRTHKTTLGHGVGRRKSAVARVWVTRGGGKVSINGKPVIVYFDTDLDRQNAVLPLSLAPLASSLNVRVNVYGGGKTGQSDAVKLGIVRALLEHDENLRPAFREKDLLTSDSRRKERKKYGRAAARRRFQFVKR